MCRWVVFFGWNARDSNSSKHEVGATHECPLEKMHIFAWGLKSADIKNTRHLQHRGQDMLR